MRLHTTRIRNVDSRAPIWCKDTITVKTPSHNKCIQVMNTSIERGVSNGRPYSGTQKTAMTNSDHRTPPRGIDQEAGMDSSKERRPVWLRIVSTFRSIFWNMTIFSKERELVRPVNSKQESRSLLCSTERTTCDESTFTTRCMRD